MANSTLTLDLDWLDDEARFEEPLRAALTKKELPPELKKALCECWPKVKEALEALVKDVKKAWLRIVLGLAITILDKVVGVACKT